MFFALMRIYKGGVLFSFKNYDCSRTASQVTPKVYHQHANDGIQFYDFCH